MARRHLRSDFSTDTDDLSLETTVPTDFSLSPDEFSELADSSDRKKRISKQLLERKQLLHDLQVVKIELSQRSLLLDNVKAEYMQKAEELEEKLADALHQKQILQARLESELSIQQEDSKRRQEKIQKELDTILRRQQQLESTNERLQEKAVDVRQRLKDLQLTENQYYALKEQPDEELSLKDFVAVKLYETLHPWKIENSELRSRCKAQADELHRGSSSLNRCKDELEDTTHKLADFEMKHQRLNLAFADVKSQVKAGDFKIENYDRVKKERDEYDSELKDTKKQLAYLEASLSSTSKERDDFNSELTALRQQTTLLKQDKEFFAKQVTEFQNKMLYSEEKVIQLNEQLDRSKQSREDLYDKYVASRDQYKSEYEGKLRDELEQIRVRTNTEIDRLKSSTRELFERENRNLREARDLALSERDRALGGERDVQSKYEQLLNDYRQAQVSGDTKISDLSNDVKIKAFEGERIQIVYDEAMKNFRESQLNNEKTAKKLEVLTKEYFTLQTGMEKNITELESQIREKDMKLKTYEQLEHELDEVVMQAAEVEDEDEAERVLFSYGYGANVPTTAKRRLKQSIHLARRVLQLERANSSLKNEIERQQENSAVLTEKVKSTNDILDKTQQPQHYLVDSIRQRDAVVSKQKQQISILEANTKKLEKERSELVKSKNQMALDLERLLNHKEEMAVMKQVVLGMSHHSKTMVDNLKVDRLKSPKAKKESVKSKSSKLPGSRPKALTFQIPEKDENMHIPGPTQFTVNEPNDWHRKLQLKKQACESKYSLMNKAAL